MSKPNRSEPSVSREERDVAAARAQIERERKLSPPKVMGSPIMSALADDPMNLGARIAAIMDRMQPMTAEQQAQHVEDEIARRVGDIRRKRHTLLEESGIADHMTDAACSLVVRNEQASAPAIDHVKEWLGTSIPMLALFGGRGVGKTVAAAFLLARQAGSYVEADELVRLRTAGFGPDRERYERLLQASVLVVDELGLERNEEIARLAMHDVVNKRQRSRTRTLALGNLDHAAFTARYDSRTHDRMREVAIIRGLVGGSRRRDL